MDFQSEQMVERKIYLDDVADRIQVEEFLNKNALSLDKGLEYLMGIFAEGQLIATGAIRGQTLRCIAIDPAYQGTGVINRVVSHLVQVQFERGQTHLFIYTKPESAQSFAYLGFQKIAQVESKAVLLENRAQGIGDYLQELQSETKAVSITGLNDHPVISAIVVNCNPFTLGHQHLIETAAKMSDLVHLFVLWEDQSVFPAQIRYRLVQEGVQHLPNVVVHQGRDYLISNATFPSYFIQEPAEVVKVHAQLDLQIFSQLIAPTLGIGRRYVGEEPYCLTTRTYNQIMKQFLPEQGIEVVEIPRKRDQGQWISASAVRRALKSGQLEQVKHLVPESTFNFLKSQEAEAIIQHLINRDERH